MVGRLFSISFSSESYKPKKTKAKFSVKLHNIQNMIRATTHKNTSWIAALTKKLQIILLNEYITHKVKGAKCLVI